MHRRITGSRSAGFPSLGVLGMHHLSSDGVIDHLSYTFLG